MTDSLLAAREVECGSDEEYALRADWMARMMFGRLLTPPLAYDERRGYEEWLHAEGYVLV